MRKTECIDIEPYGCCFTLPCVCKIININISDENGERYI